MSDTPKDLLLEDYRYRAESLWKNEQGGETRVNLFIGLLTLVGGLMATLVTSDKKVFEGDMLRLVALAGLFTMLVLGLITMLRMITRNKNTDQAKHDLDIIRQTIKDRFDEEGLLLHYTLFGRSRVSEPEKVATQDNGKNHSIQARNFGGLAHTMAALNSLLLAGLVAGILWPVAEIERTQVAISRANLLLIVAGVLAAFIVGLSLQVWYIEQAERRARQANHAGLPTHAGGVIFRQSGEQMEYLLVRPNSDADEWVLPKGHIEPGEGHSEAAVREVREESGIFARPIVLVDRIKFATRKEQVDAKFYLMEMVYATDSSESREIQWVTANKAMEKLAHIESRYLVRAAEKLRSTQVDHAHPARSA